MKGRELFLSRKEDIKSNTCFADKNKGFLQSFKSIYFLFNEVFIELTPKIVVIIGFNLSHSSIAVSVEWVRH